MRRIAFYTYHAPCHYYKLCNIADVQHMFIVSVSFVNPMLSVAMASALTKSGFCPGRSLSGQCSVCIYSEQQAISVLSSCDRHIQHTTRGLTNESTFQFYCHIYVPQHNERVRATHQILLIGN